MKNKTTYIVDGEEHQLVKKKAKMFLRFLGLQIPILQTFYQSIYGPALKNKSGVFAIRTPSTTNINALEQWWRMNKARSFSEFYSFWSGMPFRAITLAMPIEMIPFFISPTEKFPDVTPITIGKKPSLETPKKHCGTATIPPKNSPKSSRLRRAMSTTPITVHFIRLRLMKTQTPMTMPKR